jgi:uncharacterized protein (TIRG00374 family)
MRFQKKATHIVLRTLLTILIIGFALYVLLPKLGQIDSSIRALRNGRWPFLFIALIGSGLTFIAEVWMIRLSVNKAPPWIRTTIVEIGAFTAATLTPGGLGWLAVNHMYLVRSGNESSPTRTALSLFILLTFLAGLLLAIMSLPFVPEVRIKTPSLSDELKVVEIFAAIMIIVGVFFWIPRFRKWIIREIRPILNMFPEMVKKPVRTVLMIVAAVSSHVAYTIALAGSIAAFGPTPSIANIFLAFIISTFVSKISPTPGNLGAMETLLVTLLSRLDVFPGEAVTAVLTFRFFTFWIPLPIGAWALQYARNHRWIS